MQKERVSSSKVFLVGAILGGVLGATAGLLMAPKSGKELRNDLSETYEDISERAQEFADVAGKRGHAFAKNMSSQTSEWTDRARDIVDTVSSGLKSWTENAHNGAHPKEHQNRLEEVLDWATLGISIWQKINKRS